MKVWSILQPNTLRADSLCALKNVKQRLQKEIHGWSSQSFPVTCCVFAEYQMRPNSDLLNMFVKILNWDKPRTILGGQRTYMTRSWLNISTFYSINLFIKLLINSVKVPSLCRGSGLMVRVSRAGLTQWIQSSREINHHNSWTVGDAPWQVIPCSHPGRDLFPGEVWWHSHSCFLWTEVKCREREGSKGKLGPAHLITQGAKPPGGDIRAVFQVGIKLLKLSMSCVLIQSGGGINPIFAGGKEMWNSLGQQPVWGCTRTKHCLCFIVNLFFDKELARGQDLQLWLPLDDLNQPKSAWSC